MFLNKLLNQQNSKLPVSILNQKLNTMKKFILSIALSLLVALPSSFAFNARENFQQKPDKIEIKHKELPEKSRIDIIDKFHGAKIIKAYKEVLNGEIVGYQVEIEKEPKSWVVLYDDEGNPKNKVVPNQ